MRQDDHRAMARRGLADELDRLAAGYRDLARDLARDRAVAHALDRDRDRDRAHALALVRDLALYRNLDHVLALDRNLDHVLALALDLDCGLALALGPDPDPDPDPARARALDLAGLLENQASRLHLDGQPETPARRDDRVEAQVLSWLARILPAAERSRFLAEQRGNLGDCQRWHQRADHLVCLAFGIPRLAVMMRRSGRRWPA